LSKEGRNEEECEEGEAKDNIRLKRNRRHRRPPFILRYTPPEKKIKKINQPTHKMYLNQKTEPEIMN